MAPPLQKVRGLLIAPPALAPQRVPPPTPPCLLLQNEQAPYNRAICIAVASRTVNAVTGATAYEVGIAGETAKFGGMLSVAAGASNIGVIGPQAFYADTPLRVTALGGAFTGGRVRLALFFLGFSL